MKHCFIYFIAFFISTCVNAQGTSFYFTQAQPSESSALKSFSEKFQGEYVSLKDSVTGLIITDTIIYSEIGLFLYTTLTHIDTTESLTIVDDEIHGIRKGETYPYVQSNDTLFYYLKNRSAIFELNENNVGKLYDSTLVINYKEDNGYWTSLILQFDDDNQLEFMSFDHDNAEKEIQSIKKIKKKKLVVQTYLATPDNMEFGSLLRSKGFEKDEIYYKVEETEEE